MYLKGLAEPEGGPILLGADQVEGVSLASNHDLLPTPHEIMSCFVYFSRLPAAPRDIKCISFNKFNKSNFNYHIIECLKSRPGGQVGKLF